MEEKNENMIKKEENKKGRGEEVKRRRSEEEKNGSGKEVKRRRREEKKK